ncbi:MAG: hypothetical protein AB8H86_00265 [Polyangiales bacterium]
MIAVSRPWALAASCLALALAACGSSDEPTGPTTSERGEVDAVLEALTGDEAILVLEEADRFVADDLPARAAQMLESGALPSMRRHIERVEALEVSSALGRRLKSSALEKLRARETSTAAYARILARGLVEDLAFVEASAAQRQAEAALLDLAAEIQAIRRPEDDDEEENEEEAAPRPMGFDEFDDEFDEPQGPRVRPR